MKDPEDTRTSGVTSEKEKLLQDFYENLSLGGFKYMFLKSGVKQKIWIIIFFLALVSSVSVIYQVIKDYSENNFYSTFERIEMDELDLPTITICGFNSLRDSKLKQLNLNEHETEKFLSLYRSTFAFKATNISQAELDEVAEILKQQTNVTTMIDLINRTDSTMYDMITNITSKSILKKPCKLFTELCSGDDFRLTSILFKTIATCSQFNPYVEGQESIKASDHGMLASFAVIADLRLDDIRLTMLPVDGLFVFVTPYGTPAFLPEYTYSYSAEAGQLNMLKLSLRKHERLPPPYGSKCGKKDFKIIRGYPYSKAMCEVDCIIAEVYKRCGCVGYEFDRHVGNHRICSIEEHRCYLQNSKTLKREMDSSVEKRKLCNCPLACLSYSYKVDHSKLRLGNQNRIDQLIKTRHLNTTSEESENYIKNNMVGIWVYYRDLVLLQETETPSVTLSSLLGTVGGNIGLFVSFSVITFYETIHFLWDYSSLTRKQRNLKQYVDHDAL